MGDIQNVMHSKANIWLDGVDLGFTSAPVSFNLSKDFYDIEVEQVKGIVASNRIREDLTISTELTEASMANLQKTWEYSSSLLVGGTFLSIGSELNGSTHTLIVIVDAPTATGKAYMNYFIFKVVSMDASNLSFAKNENTRLPVTFKCLKDTTNDNRFGYVVLSDTAGSAT